MVSMRVVIDAEKKAVVVEQCVKGKLTQNSYLTAYTSVHYPDIKFTDSFEKQYRFTTPTYVSEVYYPHLDADNDTYAKDLGLKASALRSYNEDMAARMTLEYLDDEDNGRWKTIDWKTTEDENISRAWQKVTFPAVKTTALRLINQDPTQHHRMVYKLMTTRDFEQCLQLRIEKRNGLVSTFLHNRLIDVTALPKVKKAATLPPTRIGLFSDGEAQVTVTNDLYYPIF